MIIALAGLSKSGKSFLAEHLGHKLDWPVLSFGNYVRHLAASNNSQFDFNSLQQLGQSLVDAGPENFVEAVLKHGNFNAKNNLVLDGVRHVEVLDALQAYVEPNPVKLVLIEASLEVLSQRHHEAGQEIADMLAGPAEQQVQSILANRAILSLDGNKPVHYSIKKILELVT